MTTSTFFAKKIDGLRELWGETLGDPRVCVAVLDGAVDLAHPSFLNLAPNKGQSMAARGEGPNKR